MSMKIPIRFGARKCELFCIPMILIHESVGFSTGQKASLVAFGFTKVF